MTLLPGLARPFWIVAAYDEIARWNMDARHQPIQALILYRWSVTDQTEWSIVNRFGIRFAPNKPWQGDLWHADRDTPWQNPHRSQDEEWRAFEFARRLDDTAGKLSLAMGGSGIMGFSHPAIGHMSVDQMFIDFSASESNQVLAFFDLLAGPQGGSRELAALRNSDLELFATLHCGPRQVARYGHDLRCALQAYRRLGPAL
jgi:hypothetical protein